MGTKKGIKVEWLSQKDTAVQDLKVTRTQGKKKEREVTSSSGVLKGNLKEPPQSAGAGMSKAEKRMRDLRKKLKAIDALLQKEAGGVELDEQQKLKVARMAELMEEMMSMFKESMSAVKVLDDAGVIRCGLCNPKYTLWIM